MFNQVGGAAAEVLLKFCVVFVIAICSFAVGTFAGKKFTEDQYRLSTLETEHVDRDTASVGHLDTKPENALSEEDLQSLTEEFSNEDAKKIAETVTDKHKDAEALAEQALEKLDEEMKALEKTKSAHAEPRKPQAEHGHAEKAEHAQAAKTVDHTTMVAERIATNQQHVVVAPKKEVSRIPASYPSLQAASSLGKFTVQVASYKSEDEAKAFADDLTKKGLAAYYVKAELKGQTWYRVSIGSFTGQDEANKHLQKIYQDAKLKGFVTRISQ
ncbi:MAG: SPOR domain-containing protein [Bdellovibrionales bacterium]|nr:SPOR domain-containing protein [Bdellovibrionales bacterium]